MRASDLKEQLAGKCSEDAAPQYLLGARQTWLGTASGVKQLAQRLVEVEEPVDRASCWGWGPGRLKWARLAQ